MTVQEENRELLRLFEPLRVADVRDGMDFMGYHHYGSLDKDIRPLWRTKICGIARTARYLPFEGPAPTPRGDEYGPWSGWYYNTVATYPWVQEIEDGDIICLDMSGVDVGLMGSDNTLACIAKGARGFVTNGGGIRDSDECIMQKIPVWSYFVSQKMDQARIRFDQMNVPVAIGGVAIYPGDVIVADGDGVIAVPRAVARDVAKYGGRELQNDKNNRRAKYDVLGWAHDDTVRN
jgi:4-hydroxy-4-methyl-2-oxoglutarate aldolase